MRYVGLYSRETMEPPRVANIIWAYDFIMTYAVLCSHIRSVSILASQDLSGPSRIAMTHVSQPHSLIVSRIQL